MKTEAKTLPKTAKLVPISEAAEILGVSMDTIRRWDKAGLIKSSRPDGKTRHFSISDLEKLKFSKPLSITEAAARLGVSASTLRRLEQKGLIAPSRNKQGERLYSYEAVEKFLNSQYFMSKKEVEEKILEPLKEPEQKKEETAEEMSENKETRQRVVNSVIGQHEEKISRLDLFRKALYGSAVFLIISFAAGIALITVSFILFPEETAGFFGYRLNNSQVSANSGTTAGFAGQVLGAKYSGSPKGSVLGVSLKPFSRVSLEIVKQVSPDTYQKIAKEPFSSVNDIFTTDEEGNVAIKYTLALPDSTYLEVPDTGLVENLNADLVDGRQPGEDVGDLVVRGQEGTISWLRVLTANIAAGTILTEDLADSAVTSAKISDGTVSGADLADDSVTSGKITNGTITNEDISSTAGIDDGKLAQIEEANKVAGSAVELKSGGGLVDSDGLSLLRSCSSGQVLAWNGSDWACATPSAGGGSGDITSVTAGDGLTGGGSSGDVTLASVLGTSIDGSEIAADTITLIDVAAALDLDSNLTFASADSSTDYGVVFDNSSTGDVATLVQVTTSGTGATVATAIDLSDADIGIALALGSNDITIGGATLSSSEVALLDGGITLGELTNTGTLTASNVDIDGGTIDGTVIGGSSAAAATFTTVTTSGAINSQTISSAASFTGTLNVATGYKVGGSAPSGQYLRGDGTNFVSSAIQVSDLPTITTAGGWTDDGTLVRLTTVTDNIGIGSTADIATLGVRGDGITTDFTFRTQDSAGTDRFVIQDDGNVGIGTTAPTTNLVVKNASDGNVFQILDPSSVAALTLTTVNSSSAANQLTVNGMGIFGGVLVNNAGQGNIRVGNNFYWSNSWNGGTGGQSYTIDPTDATDTSGTRIALTLIPTSFAPTSGTAKYIATAITPTINQTGSATGDYTALQVNVTEMAATGTNKFLLDLQTNAESKLVVTSVGNVGIGTTAPSEKLEVVGSGRIKGDLFINDGTTDTLTIGSNGSITQNQYSAGSPTVSFDAGAYTFRGAAASTNGSFLTITPTTLDVASITATNLTIQPTNTLTLSGNLLNISAGPSIGHATLKLQTSNGTGYFQDGSNNRRRIHIMNAASASVANVQLAVTSDTATYTPLRVNAGVTTPTANIFEVQRNSINVFIVDSVGNVGVGTTAPATLLSLGASGQLSVGLGTSAAPSYTFTGDLDTGVWSSAADTINLSTGGSERLRVDGSGNVGIGTTATSNKLTIAGNTLTTGDITFDDDGVGVVLEDSSAINWRVGTTTEGRLTTSSTNATVAPASIAQSAIAQVTSPTNSVTGTFESSGAAAAGNRMILIMGWTLDPGTVTAEGWTLETTVTPSGNQPIVKIYTKSASGGETGATVSWTDTSASASLYVAELNNIDATTYLDVPIVTSNSASSGVTTITTGPTDTTSANALAIAFAAHGGAVSSFAWDEPSGVSVDQSVGRLNVGKRVISSATTITTAPTWTTSRRTVGGLVVFRTSSEDPTTVTLRKQAIKTKTASYAIRASDDLIVFNGSSLTATLPSAATPAQVYTVKNINSSALTVATTSSQTIDGSTTKTLQQYESMTVMSDGSNWHTVQTGNTGGWTDTGPLLTLSTATDNIGIGMTADIAVLGVRGDGTTTGFTFRTQDSAGVDRLVIQDGGNVGIGTTAPATMLDVAGAIQTDLSGAQTSVALCGSHSGGSGASVSNVEIVDCTGTPAADYMEMYATESNVETGDIVIPGNPTTTLDGEVVAKLAKSSASYQKQLIGVISDPSKAGDFNSIGYNIREEDRPMPVALNGRVYVNISPSSEAIEAGDYITSSSEPGRGMKATDAGVVVGKALESWTPASGKTKVMIFISTTWYDPGVSLTADGSINVEDIIQEVLSRIEENEVDGDALAEGTTPTEEEAAPTVTPTQAPQEHTLLSIIEREEGITLEKNTWFEGESVFEKLATYMAKVVFKDAVVFEVAPTFATDMGGYGVIEEGSQYVEVTFDREYAVKPIVNVTLTSSELDDGAYEDQIVSGRCLASESKEECQAQILSEILEGELTYAITGATTKGFTIALNKLAPVSVTFSWNALQVDSPKTAKGFSQAVSVSPTPEPEEEPETSQEPVTEATPTPTAEATVTPTP